MNKIIIDIRRANQSQQYENREELFQREAFEDVTKILKEHFIPSSTEVKEITDCRFHNTIFIDADRGAGKTAFMLNLEKYYNESVKGEKDKYKYCFLNPVDPTLLEHTEKFLSIILARIVERVKDELDDSNKDFSNEAYFSSLEKLSKSLTAIKTLNNDLGIEEIASSKSSLRLEQHAHSFFKVVCELLNVHALVMLIDDVDMAFDKGFDVLEVVRKYLSSPYIIPIVAGDMKLYREVVETKFMDKIGYSHDIANTKAIKNIFENGCSSEIDKENRIDWDNSILGCNHDVLIQNRREILEKKSLIDDLVRQYINKVFPNEYHIKLESIFNILKNNQMIVKITDELEVPYTEIKDFEIRHINLGINQVKFTYSIISDNTRDLVQYLYSKKDIYKNFFNKDESFSYSGKYEKYIPQNVIKKYDEHILKFIFEDTENFYKKSLDITSNFYKYSNNQRKKELACLVSNDVNSYVNNRYSVYKALTNDFFKTSKLSHEKANEEYAITRKSIIAIDKNNFNIKDKYIADLFIFNNYSKNDATKNFIFSGNFLEMTMYSLSISTLQPIKHDGIQDLKIKDTNIYDSLEENYENYVQNILPDCLKQLSDNYDLERITDNIYNIADKVPFNSEFFHNEGLDELNLGKSEEEDISDISITYKIEELETLTQELLIWKSLFINNVKLNSISLYEIMHKFFNNLNVIKEKSYRDRPIAFMQRIVLIFINSVAYFENTNGKVSHTNMAIVNSKKKDFSVAQTLTYTAASFLNIKPMLQLEGSLTRALFFHPIISKILFSKESDKLYLVLCFPGQNDLITSEEILKKYGFKASMRLDDAMNVIKNILDDIQHLSKDEISKIKESNDFNKLISITYANENYKNLLAELKEKFKIDND